MKTKTPSLASLLKPHKLYYLNEAITEKNFPRPKVIQTEGAKVIKLGKWTSSEDCLKLIKDAGCRPANIYELASYIPKMEKGQWLIGFGSEWTDDAGYHRVPHLYRNSDGDLRFRLGSFASDWRGGLGLLCFCDENLDTEVLSPESDTLNLESRLMKLERFREKVIELIPSIAE